MLRTPSDNLYIRNRICCSIKIFEQFWRFLNTLEIPFNNCEIELDLSWSRNCVITETLRTAAVAANPTNSASAVTETTGATFQLNNTKIYVPVVTLSVNDNIKFQKIQSKDLKEKSLRANKSLK